MSRQYTEEEIQIANRFIQDLVPLGFVDSEENGNLLAEKIGDAPFTAQALLEAARALAAEGKLGWRSKAEMRYDEVFGQLTQEQKNAVAIWWNLGSTKRTLVQDGDKGFENLTQVIEWAKGKEFSNRTFDFAVSNIANTSRRPLHWAPRESSFKGGRHSGQKVEWPEANKSAFDAIQALAIGKNLVSHAVKDSGSES